MQGRGPLLETCGLRTLQATLTAFEQARLKIGVTSLLSFRENDLNEEALRMYGTTLIRSGDLREEDLPASYADWHEYARFAATFEPRSREEGAELANWALARWQRTGELPRTLDELRTCLWFELRRWRFLNRVPDDAGMRYCGALVRRVRELL